MVVVGNIDVGVGVDCGGPCGYGAWRVLGEHWCGIRHNPDQCPGSDDGVWHRCLYRYSC